MNFLAGVLAYAGAISLAVWEYFTTSGTVMERWGAAREAVVERFPLAPQVSVNAIMGYAEQAAAVGNRQAHGGPGYIPPENIIPDVRRIERDAGIPQAGTPGDRPPGIYYQNVIVEVFDERWPDDPIHQLPVEITSPELLTIEELIAQAELQGEPWIDLLINSDPDRFERQELHMEFRFAGIYQGY